MIAYVLDLYIFLDNELADILRLFLVQLFVVRLFLVITMHAYFVGIIMFPSLKIMFNYWP